MREEDTIPPRSAINPRGIEDALEYAFILDSVAPGVARFRLAGSHLTDLMGMEVRGMPITAMFVPAARKELSTLLAEVCAPPAGRANGVARRTQHWPARIRGANAAGATDR